MDAQRTAGAERAGCNGGAAGDGSAIALALAAECIVGCDSASGESTHTGLPYATTSWPGRALSLVARAIG